VDASADSTGAGQHAGLLDLTPFQTWELDEYPQSGCGRDILMTGNLYLMLCLVLLPSVAVADEHPLDCKNSVLTVVESPDVFQGSPCDRSLVKVAYPRVGYVSGITGSDHVMTVRKKSDGAWVMSELTRTGAVVREYPLPLSLWTDQYIFSPDGKSYLYTDTHRRWILRNLVTSTEDILFVPEAKIFEDLLHPAMSPDGKAIVFSYITSDGPSNPPIIRLCLVNVPHVFDPTECLERPGAFPSFSPDGLKLAYWELSKQQSDSAWNLVIREVGALGQDSQAKTVAVKHFHGHYWDSRWIGPIRWSPDSQWIVWSEKDDPFSPYSQLFRRHVDGNDVHRIELDRPWWITFLRKYVMSGDHNRFHFSFHWAAVSPLTDEK
jgi:hypothetical protein